MKKYVISLLLVLTILFSFTFVYAEGLESFDLSSLISYNSASDTQKQVDKNAVIRVIINDTTVSFEDSNPEIINNRTMVPMRKIFEEFNATVDWDNDTKTVVAKTSQKEITLTIDQDTIKVKNLTTNEVEESKLDQAPVIRNNRTLVPVRFIAEGLDKEVGWDANQRAVIVIDMDALAQQAEKEIPALKKLFDLNIGEKGPYVSTSKINGSFSYEDLDKKENSETVKITGTNDIETDLLGNMESNLKIKIEGNNGPISKAIEEQSLSEFDVKMVYVDGKLYVGLMKDGKYEWTDTTSSLNMSQIPSVSDTASSVKNYKDLVKYIASITGDLKVESYETISKVITLLGGVLDDTTITVNGNSFTINLDILKMLNSMGVDSESIHVKELVLKCTANVEGDLVLSEQSALKLEIAADEFNEKSSLDLTVDTEYQLLNGASNIVAPM